MNSRISLAIWGIMKKYRTRSISLFVTLFLGLFLLNDHPAAAQQIPSQLTITGSDASSAPTIQLYVHAVDGQGSPISLDPSTLTILHDGSPVNDISIGSPYEAGTFTIFVLDIPQGVSDQLPTIQTAIQQYAGETYMKEQVDAVAIYTIGQLAATQLLGASQFRNEIINTFASPLAPVTGATALIDSLMGLINNLDSLKPQPDMVPQIVVFSDGTDVVSTEFEPADVPKTAAEMGVPIYTIVLSNESLDQQESQEGQNYMSQIAAGTLAQNARLSTAEDLQPIWEKLSSFREQTTVQYAIPEARGGDYTVELSLTNNPNISDSTVVTIPPGAPTVSIDLPEDSRSLSLPNLDQPVTLSLTTSVSWLDGVDREIETAQLLVNGLIVQDIDPGTLAKFDASLTNLTFGPNKIQIAIIDDQGSRAISPQVSLEISQGETSIPETVAPSTLTERIWERVRGVAIFVGGCLAVLVVLVLLIGITYLGRRSPILHRIGLVPLLSRTPFLRGYFAEARGITYKADRAKYMGRSASRYSSDIRGAGSRRGGKSGPQLPAFLEVIQATTQMPSRIELDAVEQKIGRSKSRADISFNRDATVSRVHATIVQEGDDYRIYDENSTSGTFVNEQGVLDHGLQLVDGDEIRLGAVRVRSRSFYFSKGFSVASS